MNIRNESIHEFSSVYQLIKEAFETARVSEGDEHDYVERMHKSANYIPQLSLVAEDNDKLAGYIMLTHFQVVTDTEPVNILLLAVLAVALDKRGAGIGAQLVSESFSRARALGHNAVLVVGDPAYYGRFGFRSSADFMIDNCNGIPEHNVMARELAPGGLARVAGTVRFPT